MSTDLPRESFDALINSTVFTKAAELLLSSPSSTVRASSIAAALSMSEYDVVEVLGRDDMQGVLKIERLPDHGDPDRAPELLVRGLTDSGRAVLIEYVERNGTDGHGDEDTDGST